MGYVTPADVAVSDNWQAHVDRNSKEPGTDYMTEFGTDLRMPGNGVITKVDNDPNGAEGRRLEMTMDNGQVIDFIHGYWIHGYPGQRISKGQYGIFISGASGYGQDYYYGAHVHVTLRATQGLPYSNTLDFEHYLSDDVISEDVVEMYPIRHVDGRIFTIGKQYIKHESSLAAAEYTRNVITTNDTFIPVNENEFIALLDSFGIPRDIVPANGQVWSRETQILGTTASSYDSSSNIRKWILAIGVVVIAVSQVIIALI
jgi:murein DD-endopeptidase MepM/ murein hydrolase activator NlpD